MLNLLDVNKFVRNNKLDEVKTPLIFQGDSFHPEGLFSEQIFGPTGSPQRRKVFAYINIKAKIIHPLVMKMLSRLDKKLYNMVLLNDVYRYDDKEQKLIQDDDGDLFGFEGLKKLFSEHNYSFRGGSEYREKLINFIKSNKEIFIDKIIVMPAGLRDAVLDMQQKNKVKFMDEINEHYTTVMNVANKLATTDEKNKAKKFIIINLQKAVNKLFEYIQTKIAKKKGVIRSSTLGKRVDFSARAVITGNPNLPPNKCEVPVKLAVKIFEPYFLHHVIKRKFTPDELNKIENYIVPKYGEDMNIENVKAYLTAIYKGYIKDESELIFIKDLLEEYIIEDKPVILKRDPALHRMSVQAYYPIITIKNSIGISPMICGPFGADFDGDQMAIYTVLSKEAQEEVRQKMIMSENPATMRGSSLDMGQNMNIGVYYLTKEPDRESSRFKMSSPDQYDTEKLMQIVSERYDYKFNTILIYGTTKTTIGRHILRQYMPSDVVIEEKLYKKKDLLAILMSIKKSHSKEESANIAGELQNLFFRISSMVGFSVGMSIFTIDEDLKDIRQQLTKTEDTAIQQELIIKLEERIKVVLKEKHPDFYDLVESGAAKGWTQVKALIGVKGLVSDGKGGIELVDNNYSQGFDSVNYFKGGNPARKGLADRTLNTAQTGYLTRKLVYSMASVKLSNKKDCGTTKYIELKVDKNISSKIDGRFYFSAGDIKEISDGNNFEGRRIKLRSPIYCKAKDGICQICYGRLLERNGTQDIGILSGQVVGERGTQLIMKSFHTGGSVSINIADFISELIRTNPGLSKDALEAIFDQDKETIKVQQDIILEFDLLDYERKDSSKGVTDDGQDYYYLNYLTCRINAPNFNDELFFNNKIKIIYSSKSVDEKIIRLNLKKGDYLQLDMDSSDFGNKVNTVLNLIEKKNKITNPYHLLMELFEVYKNSSDADIIHYEIIVSQLMRNRNDIKRLARLVEPYDAVCVGIKKLPFYDSWITGLLFENVGRALELGLVDGGDAENSLNDIFLND